MNDKPGLVGLVAKIRLKVCRSIVAIIHTSDVYSFKYDYLFTVY